MAHAVIKDDRDVGLCVWSQMMPQMLVAHRHRDLEFNYVHEGAITYLISGETVVIPRGRLAVLWAAMPHQSVNHRADTRVSWASVALTQVLLWHLPEAFTQVLLGRGIVVEHEHREADPHLLGQWQRDIESGEPLRQQLVLRELEARLHRMAVETAGTALVGVRACRGRKSSAAGGVPGSVQRMAECISKRFREPLCVPDVAAAAELHPHYAMALFRQHMGMTINEYITRQRVAHAQRLLVTSEESVSAISLQSGFGSTSRFFQAFKQQTGISPRQYRQRLEARQEEQRQSGV